MRVFLGIRKSIDPMWDSARLGSSSCRRSPRSSASMSFQSAIPWQVALRQSPPPLHRLEAILNGRTMIFQRTATTPLTPCLSLRVHSRRCPFPPAPIAKAESRQASSLAAKEISGDEDPCFFFGMVKLQLGDISIVDKTGTLLWWYDNVLMSDVVSKLKRPVFLARDLSGLS